jgi:hypothetical protein
MRNTTDPSQKDCLPSLADLLDRYVQRQTAAHLEGLGHAEPDGDAFPYDPATSQPIDPQLAWKEACVSAELLQLRLPTTRLHPPEWPALIARLESATAVPLALGAFPQQVRQLEPLLTGEWSALYPPTIRPLTAQAVQSWAMQWSDGPGRLLGAGVLRLLGHLDAAEQLLLSIDAAQFPTRAVYDNEFAALMWQRGQSEAARNLWQQMPDSPVSHFNRGMAELFTGDRVLARAELTRAAAGLPALGGWHHLASLYLALAQAD